jgi:hypothetical protein
VSPSNRTLRAEHSARVDQRIVQRETKRFERSLDDMVSVRASEHPCMDGRVRVIGERSKPVIIQRAWNRSAVIRTAPEVNGHFNERVVHRNDAMTIARARRWHEVRDGSTERYSDVFDQMVLEISGSLQRQILTRVACERGHHVV